MAYTLKKRPEVLSLSTLLTARHYTNKMVKQRVVVKSPHVEWKSQGKSPSGKLGRFTILRYLK